MNRQHDPNWFLLLILLFRRMAWLTSLRCSCWPRPAARSGRTPGPEPEPSSARTRSARWPAARPAQNPAAPPSWWATPSPCLSNPTRTPKTGLGPSLWRASGWVRLAAASPPPLSSLTPDLPEITHHQRATDTPPSQPHQSSQPAAASGGRK